MEICLTGSLNLNAEEAERLGSVCKVIPADQLVDEAVKTAGKIAEMSQPMVQMIKEAINQSYELPLSSGLRFERRLFQSTFGTLRPIRGRGWKRKLRMSWGFVRTWGFPSVGGSNFTSARMVE
ncbi:hypothetical protein BC938DRAFT_482453 [Jimgerdemannia flammicorona]|uniref:Uncharacterized protein n=1 Tax=Jimgerdemannia flammicorona TaxID=994334 RepID=A0A433QE15_9FUNG|nr:hypothetical protein BC938DRAFT_482453 [Jimgerdemannia flammicorona]